jgi:hypothetical protein
VNRRGIGSKVGFPEGIGFLDRLEAGFLDGLEVGFLDRFLDELG